MVHEPFDLTTQCEDFVVRWNAIEFAILQANHVCAHHRRSSGICMGQCHSSSPHPRSRIVYLEYVRPSRFGYVGHTVLQIRRRIVDSVSKHWWRMRCWQSFRMPVMSMRDLPLDNETAVIKWTNSTSVAFGVGHIQDMGTNSERDVRYP